MVNTSTEVIACHECSLSVDVPLLNESQKAECPRCGYLLTAIHVNAIQRITVFALCALIFLCAALPFEFLSFTSNGLKNRFSLLDSLNILIENHYVILAVIEIITIFAIPIIILLGLLYLSIGILRRRPLAKGKVVLKLVFALMPWSMVEIFLIGVLVSLIKILSMADIHLGLSFYAFVLFSFFLTLMALHIDKHQLTQLLTGLVEPEYSNKPLKAETVKVNYLSIQQTWALIITSIILYIPANTLPIMTTRLFGQDEPSTILGGVILLWKMGSFPIAIVIFIASIAVPVAKILVLAWLNYSVQNQQGNLTVERIKLYRIAEFIGRWSMIDVFVVIVLVSLIQLGDTMSIYPGQATLAFSGVVVITMLAAMSFDPRLISSTKMDKNNT